MEKKSEESKSKKTKEIDAKPLKISEITKTEERVLQRHAYIKQTNTHLAKIAKGRRKQFQKITSLKKALQDMLEKNEIDAIDRGPDVDPKVRYARITKKTSTQSFKKMNEYCEQIESGEIFVDVNALLDDTIASRSSR